MSIAYFLSSIAHPSKRIPLMEQEHDRARNLSFMIVSGKHLASNMLKDIVTVQARWRVGTHDKGIDMLNISRMGLFQWLTEE
jgi:hypothetical protein